MKKDIGFILSVVAIVGVVAIGILLACCNFSLQAVSLDTFIGVMATMIGLLVTFAIGWQVINALDIKNKLAEIEKLKGETAAQRTEIDKLIARSKFDSNVNQSYTLNKLGHNHKAFACTLEAIRYGLTLDDTNEELDVLLKNLKVFAVKSQQDRCYQYDHDIIVAADKEIQRSPKFALIKDKYTEAISEYTKFGNAVFADPNNDKNSPKK